MAWNKPTNYGNQFVALDRRNSIFDERTDVEFNKFKHQENCDQILVVFKSGKADLDLLIYNQDGSEASVCGNGFLYLSHLLSDEFEGGKVSFATFAGTFPTWVKKGFRCVGMGHPKVAHQQIPIIDGNDSVYPQAALIYLGNHHIVRLFETDEYKKVDLKILGPQQDNDSILHKRSNVHAVKVINRNTLQMQSWERGVGITSSCGSGACAVAVAMNHDNRIDSRVRVITDGGDLYVDLKQNGHVTLKKKILPY